MKLTKRLIVGGLIVVACVWMARKTHVMSYATTLIAQGKDRMDQAIPRELEIARVKNEIQSLDRDYQALLGPIAEKKAAVRRLEKEIVVAKENLDGRGKALLALTDAVESKEKEIAYLGNNYTLSQAKVRLAKDYASFKKAKVNLETQQKLLDAESQNLSATIDQLQKLVEQKREFEIAIAKIEAEEAVLRAQGVSSPLKADDGRVADLSNSIKNLLHAQEVERERRLMALQFGENIGEAAGPVVDVGNLAAIRDDLQGKTNTTTKVAQTSK
jgi:chromosome segregation ATPase